MDNAGKSTLLHLLKTGTVTVVQPTYNPQFEEISIAGLTIAAHDLGGHKAARRIWDTYFDEVNGIVFLVDAAAPERFAESAEELNKLLATKELAKVPFLILGNKIDAEGAVDEANLKRALGLDVGDSLTTCQSLFLCDQQQD